MQVAKPQVILLVAPKFWDVGSSEYKVVERGWATLTSMQWAKGKGTTVWVVLETIALTNEELAPGERGCSERSPLR